MITFSQEHSGIISWYKSQIAENIDRGGKVWDIHTYERRGTLKGHEGSVLCLCFSTDKKLLISSGGDAIVKVESTTALFELFLMVLGMGCSCAETTVYYILDI